MPSNLKPLNALRPLVAIAATVALLGAVGVAHGQAPPTPGSGAATVTPPVVAVLPTDIVVACVVGDRVRVVGHFQAAMSLRQRLLLVDRRTVADQPSEPFEDDYAFDWTPDAPGTYTLQVVYVQDDGGRLNAQRVTVQALDKAPLILSAFPHTTVADADLIAKPAPGSAFTAAQVTFSFDGKPLATSPGPEFKAELPIEAAPPGTHALTYQAFDSQGVRFVGGPETVLIPERVELKVPDRFDATVGGGRLTLTPTVYPGLKLSKLSYSLVLKMAVSFVSFTKGKVGGQLRSEPVPLGSSAVPPFTTAADLSGDADGTYEVQAHAVAEDGVGYDSPSYPLVVSNGGQPKTEPAAFAAVQAATEGLTSLNAQIDAYHALVRTARADEAARELAYKKGENLALLVFQYQRLGDAQDARNAQVASRQALAEAQADQDQVRTDQVQALAAFNACKSDPLFAEMYQLGEEAVPIGQSAFASADRAMMSPPGLPPGGLRVVEPRPSSD